MNWTTHDPGWYVASQGDLLGPYSQSKARDTMYRYRPHTGRLVEVPAPTDLDVLREANGVR